MFACRSSEMKLTLFARQRVSCTDAQQPEKASFIGPNNDQAVDLNDGVDDG
jgi:hypothetical protein